jgi:hypothetical protein
MTTSENKGTANSSHAQQRFFRLAPNLPIFPAQPLAGATPLGSGHMVSDIEGFHAAIEGVAAQFSFGSSRRTAAAAGCRRLLCCV